MNFPFEVSSYSGQSVSMWEIQVTRNQRSLNPNFHFCSGEKFRLNVDKQNFVNIPKMTQFRPDFCEFYLIFWTFENVL